MMSISSTPTSTQLEEARLRLKVQEEVAAKLAKDIEAKQEALEKLIAESKRAINALEIQKLGAESDIQLTKEMLSPMRRLPDDLLRTIFLCLFEMSPYCAWTLAAVSSTWRRMVLGIPRIWSKIRLVTTTSSNPDYVRLWLERSGYRVPLDIEIYLHVSAPARKRRRVQTPMPPWSPPAGEVFYAPPPTPPLFVPPAPPAGPPIQLGLQNAIPPLPLPSTAITYVVDPTYSRASRNKPQSRLGPSWGHIVFFYLTEQMHRWRRFIFRFDRQFDSMSAMRCISRDAPLLEEFEISSGEPLRYDHDFYPFDWTWLLSADTNCGTQLSNLNSVTLQYVPFKWSSPLISANLRTINIRSLSGPGMGGHNQSQVTLDRLLHIIAANPAIENLSLHFQSVQPAVLPLEATRLTDLKSLSLGGSYLLAPLIDALITPSLEFLILNIEREALDEPIAALLARSNSPPISLLSLSYQSVGVAPFYAVEGGVPWGFLRHLPHLRTLQIGHVALELLMEILGRPDEDSGNWVAPGLENLALKNCHPSGDGISRLVAFVEARNPALPGTAGGTGGTAVIMPAVANGGNPMLNGFPAPITIGNAGPPARLKCLELHECALLGEDIVKWLRTRIADVKFTEPFVPRMQRSPPYYAMEL